MLPDLANTNIEPSVEFVFQMKNIFYISTVYEVFIVVILVLL